MATDRVIKTVPRPIEKTLSRGWLEDTDACADGVSRYDDFQARNITDTREILMAMADEGVPQYSHWLVLKSISQKDRSFYGLDLASDLLRGQIAEKYIPLRVALLKFLAQETEDNLEELRGCVKSLYSRRPMWSAPPARVTKAIAIIRVATSIYRDAADDDETAFALIHQSIEDSMTEALKEENVRVIGIAASGIEAARD